MAVCWERAFRSCGFISCRMCSFPVMCLEQHVEFDCIGSWSSLFHLLFNSSCVSHASHNMIKPTKWVCAQRRLRSAWASAQSDQKSSLSTWSNLGSLATHWAQSEDSDSTGRMPRLIWIFAGRTFILLVLSCRGSYLMVSNVADEISYTESRKKLIWANMWTFLSQLKKWASTWQNQQRDCAPSEDSDEPGHPSSHADQSLRCALNW